MMMIKIIIIMMVMMMMMMMMMMTIKMMMIMMIIPNIDDIGHVIGDRNISNAYKNGIISAPSFS